MYICIVCVCVCIISCMNRSINLLEFFVIVYAEDQEKLSFMEGSMSKKFQKSYFDVLGLCCSSEVPLIERILRSMDGVKDFTVNVPAKTVIVVHDTLLISQLQIGISLISRISVTWINIF